MDDRPWMEQVFGESWQTTVAGYGSAIIALTCIVLGRVLNVPDLIVVGLGAMAAALALIGQLARSNAASRKVAGKLDHRIDTTQRQVSEVIPEAKEEARKIAAETAKEDHR